MDTQQHFLRLLSRGALEEIDLSDVSIKQSVLDAFPEYQEGDKVFAPTGKFIINDGSIIRVGKRRWVKVRVKHD